MAHLLSARFIQALKPSVKLEVFVCRQLGKEGVELRAVANVKPRPVRVFQYGGPVDEGVSARWRFVASQHPESGRFAGSVDT